KEISPSYKWITRVPETLSEAKELIENSDQEKMRSTSLNGYHLFSTEVEYGGVKLYHIKAGFEEDEGAIRKEMLRKGRFILATNELDSDKLSDEEALKAYKEQQHAERGFRFLKDPLFFADSMFLKNESRIVAMVMIMGLALMVYSLAEKRLRETLEREDETIPDQRKKPTKKPTMKRVFQVFEGITVLYMGSEMVKVLN
ncbi:MAG: IS1634 family transposase, partial [archaeon]|nr:IS1634 family transposase [archaeon]